jgi:hypothetical protein
LPNFWTYWYVLIELAIEVDDGGWIYVSEGRPYTDKELAKELGIRREDHLKKLRRTLEELDLITSSDLGICLKSFSERNYESDISTARVQKYRENKKTKENPEEKETFQERPGNVSETPQNRPDTEQNITEEDSSLATTISSEAVPTPDPPVTLGPKGLIDLWNEIWPQPLMKRAIQPTQQRLDKAKTRLVYNPTRAYWMEVFTKVKETPFLNGTGKPWRGGKAADLDWLLQNDENHVKVWEGKYDDQGKSGGGGGGGPAPGKFDGLGTTINIDDPE